MDSSKEKSQTESAVQLQRILVENTRFDKNKKLRTLQDEVSRINDKQTPSTTQTITTPVPDSTSLPKQES